MRGLLGELPSEPDEVFLLDMEASIEHMSRGTPRHVDAMLIVTEPYYRSLVTAERLAGLAHDLGIPRVMAIANKVRTPRDTETINEFCSRHAIELVASIPFDESISRADLAGVALLDGEPGAPAIAAIRGLADALHSQLLGAKTAGGTAGVKS